MIATMLASRTTGTMIVSPIDFSLRIILNINGMKTVQTQTFKALRELAMIFLVMIERDKKVNKSQRLVNNYRLK